MQKSRAKPPVGFAPLHTTTTEERAYSNNTQRAAYPKGFKPLPLSDIRATKTIDADEVRQAEQAAQDFIERTQRDIFQPPEEETAELRPQVAPHDSAQQFGLGAVTPPTETTQPVTPPVEQPTETADPLDAKIAEMEQRQSMRGKPTPRPAAQESTALREPEGMPYTPPQDALFPYRGREDVGEVKEAPPLGAIDKLRDLKDRPEQLVPFLNSAVAIKELSEVAMAAKRLSEGKETYNDLKLLQRYQVKDQQDRTFLYNVLDTAAHIPAFAGEFMVTGGLYKLGKAAAGKVAQESLEKLLSASGQKLLKRKLAQTAGKIGTGIAGATLQAPAAGALRTAAGTIERTIPEYTIKRNSQGQVDGIVTKEGEKPLTALQKAFADNWVEVVSEHSGGLLGEAASYIPERAMSSAVVKALKKLNPTAKSETFKKIVDQSAFHGTWGEVFEERLGEVGRAALGLQEYQLPTPEQIATELTAFSIPGAIGRAIEYTAKSGGEPPAKTPPSSQKPTEPTPPEATEPVPPVPPQAGAAGVAIKKPVTEETPLPPKVTGETTPAPKTLVEPTPPAPAPEEAIKPTEVTEAPVTEPPAETAQPTPIADVEPTQPATPEAEPTVDVEGEYRRGKVDDMLKPGEIVLTTTGRKTTPFPQGDFSTNRKATNTVKKIDKWLITNAIEEARSRNDEFNLLQFENINIENPPKADKDMASEYLFGDWQPPVPPQAGAAGVAIKKPVTEETPLPPQAQTPQEPMPLAEEKPSTTKKPDAETIRKANNLIDTMRGNKKKYAQQYRDYLLGRTTKTPFGKNMRPKAIYKVENEINKILAPERVNWTEEYEKEKRSETARKAYKNRFQDAVLINPNELDKYPALSYLVGGAKHYKTKKPIGELLDLFDHVYIGTNFLSAKPAADPTVEVDVDNIVDEWNEAVEMETTKAGYPIERYEDLIEQAEQELRSIVFSEKDDYIKKQELEVEAKERFIDMLEGEGLTEEEIQEVVHAGESEEGDIDEALEKVRRRANRRANERAQRDALEEVSRTEGEKPDDEALQEALDFFDQMAEESEVVPSKPKRKIINADPTIAPFDTKDSRTGEPIKAGENVWTLPDTGEMIKESTYDELTILDQSKNLFTEDLNADEKKALNSLKTQLKNKALSPDVIRTQFNDEPQSPYKRAVLNAVDQYEQSELKAKQKQAADKKKMEEMQKSGYSVKEDPQTSMLSDLEEKTDLFEQQPEVQQPPPGTADVGGYADIPGEESYEAEPSFMELPEIVELARMINEGKYPQVVKKLRGLAVGLFSYSGKKGDIKLEAQLFKDLDQAAKTLAHEIGHVVDWLPDHTLKRGNILGHMATLKRYMKHWLANRPGAPGPLTEIERAELRKLARKLSRDNAETLIDEEIEKQIPITPEDVLAIWNDATGNIKEENPDLYNYIARLSRAEKKSIVKEAKWGNVVEDLQRFSKIVKEKTGRKIKLEPSEQEIYERYKQLVRDEIKKRSLFERDVLQRELENFTIKWKPFDVGANPKYTKYRFSPAELYADAFSALVTNPKFLRDNAPHFYEAFFNYLGEKPAVQDAWNKVQNDIISGKAQSNLVKRTLEGFQKGEKEWADSVERSRKTLWSKDAWGTQLIDKYYSILNRVKKVGESNIPADRNPRYKIEEMVYSGSEAEGYLADMDKFVLHPSRELGITNEEFGLYLMLHRIAGERSDYANPLGWTPDRAKQQIAEIEAKYGDTVKQMREDFIRIRKEWFVDRVREANMYSPELMEKIENTDEYVTFDVNGHLESTYGKEASSHIYKQIGTLNTIKNPLTATLMKDILLMRSINRNNAAESVVQFFKKYVPDEIEDAERKWNGFTKAPIETSDPNKGLIVYLQNGKVVGAYVPKHVAESFKYNPIEDWVIVRFARAVSAPIKTLFTGKNPGFYPVNAVRDYKSAVKQVPHATVWNYTPYYLKSIIPAFKSAFGIEEPQVREMLKNKMLISVTNFRGDRTDDVMLERLLKRHHLRPHTWDYKILRPLRALWDYIENVGIAIERMNKIAADQYIKENYPDMPKEIRAHIVRTRAGSPDFLRQGMASPLYNNIFIYSNAQKEGLRSAIESAKDEPGRYAWKSFSYSLMPKLLMMGAGLGLLGWWNKEIMERASEYDKSNYTVIPLGITSDGRGVYFRMPEDETGRLFGGITWKIMQQEKDKMWVNLLDYMAGQAPTLNPLISVIISSIIYASGRNPYDFFRGRNVIDEQVFSAGGFRSHKEFVKYISNQMGVGIIHRFKSNDIGEIQTELEKVLGFPVSSNILGRFIKITDTGIREDINDEWKEIRKLSDEQSLLAREGINKMLNDEKPTERQVLAMAQKMQTVDNYLLKALSYKYGNVYTDKLISARSVEEREVVLRRMLSDEFITRQIEPKQEQPETSKKEDTTTKSYHFQPK